MAHVRDDIRIKPNLCVRLRKDDKIIKEVREHNVFVINGRDWLTKLIGSRAYPTLTSEANMVDTDLGTSDTYSLQTKWGSGAGTHRTYRVRWVGVGTGGYLQSVTPPGPGGYTELPTIKGMERPVTIRDTASGVPGETFEYLGQVNVQDASSELDFPAPTGTIVYRRVFAENEISFVSATNGASVDYDGTAWGTSVPISEVGLFTSEASPFTFPHTAEYASGNVRGFVAYGIFEPIVKTPLVTMEVIWEITLR